jgi:hypothetical protein
MLKFCETLSLIVSGSLSSTHQTVHGCTSFGEKFKNVIQQILKACFGILVSHTVDFLTTSDHTGDKG